MFGGITQTKKWVSFIPHGFTNMISQLLWGVKMPAKDLLGTEILFEMIVIQGTC